MTQKWPKSAAKRAEYIGPFSISMFNSFSSSLIHFLAKSSPIKNMSPAVSFDYFFILSLNFKSLKNLMTTFHSGNEYYIKLQLLLGFLCLALLQFFCLSKWSIPVTATQSLYTVIQTKNTNRLQFSNTMSVILNTTQLINICSDTIAKIVTNKY